jgi:Zn ribbon nucleic-acid-binding protein
MKTALKKDTACLSKVARCPQCRQRDAFVYLEEYRHKIMCVACGFDDYLRNNLFNNNINKNINKKQYERSKNHSGTIGLRSNTIV